MKIRKEDFINKVIRLLILKKEIKNVANIEKRKPNKFSFKQEIKIRNEKKNGINNIIIIKYL